MKLIIVFLTTGLLQVHATGYSQEITFSGKKVSLEKVFVAIESQTNYNVVYEGSLLINAKPVNITAKKKRIQDFLTEVLSSQGLDFEIQNTTIIISRRITPDLSQGLGENLSTQPPPITVKGKVLNEKGEPVAASIIVKGTKNGTTTDGYGNFILNNVNDKATLIISGINIETSEIKIDGRTEITVAAITRITSEEEVVIKTNYYSTTKRLSTGNISKVTSKEIANQPVVSPLLALQGRVPGLEITMPPNAIPGIAPTIRIRGNNSLRVGGKGTSFVNDGNYPLYVIDGVPVKAIPMNSFVGADNLSVGGYDPLSSISPENIESIEVLKDADATAIYGSRGSNGVILITTKAGSRNIKGTDLDLNVYKGIGRVSRKLDLLNTQQYLDMRREAFSNDEIATLGDTDFDLKYWDPNRYTDWQEVLTGGTANISDIQAAVSSGNHFTSFRLACGFHKETLVYPGDFGYYRVSGQLSLNHTSKNGNFLLSGLINYGIDKNRLFTGDFAVGKRLTLSPNSPRLFNDDGSLNWEIHEREYGIFKNTWINPLSYLQNESIATTDNLVSNVNLKYTILPGLSLLASLGYSRILNIENMRRPGTTFLTIGLIESDSIFRGRTLTIGDQKQMSWILEPKLTYTKKHNEHELEIMVGTTWQKQSRNYLLMVGDRYTSDIFLNSLEGAGRVAVLSNELSEYKYASVYGRVSYNWRQKYLINLTGRRDGSSRFGPNNQFGNFGAVGIGWIFSEDGRIKEYLPSLSFGKLRASYGITGSDAVQDYKFYDLYTRLNSSTYTYQGSPGVIPDALLNPDFKWESTNKLELGLELGFFNNRLGFELSWYRNQSSNQLVDYTLSAIAGFPSVVANFPATVENTGWEGTIRSRVMQSGQLKWDVSFNISFPRNRLTRFDGIEDSPYAALYKIGQPLSVRLLYLYKGVNVNTGWYEFEDLNKDGILNQSDQQLMLPMDRKYYGGMVNTLQFKGFEVSALLQYSNQPSLRYLPGVPGDGSLTNQTIEVLNRWYISGDETNIQRFTSGNPAVPGQDSPFNLYSRLQNSDFNIENASFVRLKSLSIGYMINPSFLKKKNLQLVRLFIQGYNLLTITKYTGLDPETGSGIPPLRMITAGVQLKL